MADDSELARVLSGYGEGYRNPLMDGDSADFNTANVLAGMDARQTAKEYEGQLALSRILASLTGLGAGVHRATAGNPNIKTAVDRHIAYQDKINNPYVNAVTEPFLRGYLRFAAPPAARVLRDWEQSIVNAGEYVPFPQSFLGAPGSLVKSHAQATGAKLNHLDRVSPPSGDKTLY